MSEIINKVAQSGLITIDLEGIYPSGKRVALDIAPQLWQGIALREKDFREWIRTTNWSEYQGAHVAIYCSVDAIIPHWAYMLIASALSGIARTVVFGSTDDLESELFGAVIRSINPEEYRDKRIVIKGCSEREVPVSAYMDLVSHLQPVVRSIFFGEPCSTVPVYKRT
jgi:hypothetical protein